MLSPSHEFRVVFKGISSSDIDLTNVLLGHGHRIFRWLRIARRRRCPFYFNCQNIKKKYLRTKVIYTQLQILQVRITQGGMDVCSYECCVLSGTLFCFGSIISATRSTVCVFVLVC